MKHVVLLGIGIIGYILQLNTSYTLKMLKTILKIVGYILQLNTSYTSL